jgi:hypothetical protein
MFIFVRSWCELFTFKRWINVTIYCSILITCQTWATCSIACSSTILESLLNLSPWFWNRVILKVSLFPLFRTISWIFRCQIALWVSWTLRNLYFSQCYHNVFFFTIIMSMEFILAQFHIIQVPRASILLGTRSFRWPVAIVMAENSIIKPYASVSATCISRTCS